MNPNSVFVNDEVAKQLGPSLGRQGAFQSYSGTDISAFIYLPLLAKSSMKGKAPKKSKLFATLQTMSISSTRSVSPVRVFGRSSPLAYTRGARTIAGTLVFASVNEDVFQDIYDEGIAESTLASSSSLLSDQLPPFSIVITAANEKGAAAIHAVHGITLVNYGTTYSIDDLYTEVTYTYVATDVVPLISTSVSSARSKRDDQLPSSSYPNVSDLVQKNIKKAYGTEEDMVRRALMRLNSETLDGFNIQ
tara:strand:+ start:73447 stop:74190 length:744 start_codon:yes stop_codon:yes gene_type:complete